MSGPVPDDPPRPDGARPEDAGPAPEPAARAPSGGIFGLDRPVPALYLLAWVLSGAGVMLLFVGLQADPGVARAGLVLAGLASLVGGLLCATGYQLVARRGRGGEAYRGPSPVLAFGLIFVLATLMEGALALLGVPLGLGGWGLVTALVVSSLAYLFTVWLLAVRGGALSWVEMGWPPRGPGLARRSLAALAYGFALALPLSVIVVLWSSLVASVLGVEAPAQFELPATAFDALALLLAAAVLAPVFEELFFRGFAYTAWRRDLGVRAALVRSGLFFAAAHTLNPGSGVAQALLMFLVILPPGIFLGWLRETRGIFASIAGHATYNGLLVLLLLLAHPPAG